MEVLIVLLIGFLVINQPELVDFVEKAPFIEEKQEDRELPIFQEPVDNKPYEREEPEPLMLAVEEDDRPRLLYQVVPTATHERFIYQEVEQ